MADSARLHLFVAEIAVAALAYALTYRILWFDLRAGAIAALAAIALEATIITHARVVEIAIRQQLRNLRDNNLG